MDVKAVATGLIAEYGTNNPFELAEILKIQLLKVPLKTTLGYYHKYVRVRTIILNKNLTNELKFFVCSHELGHAICHTDINTQKLKMYTLFSTNKIEREANTFAVELQIPDRLIRENKGRSIYDIARMVGVPQNLASLKKFTP